MELFSGSQSKRVTGPDAGHDPRLLALSLLPLLVTRGVYTLDLSSELAVALEQIFDSQRGCDLSIRVKVKEEEDLGLCAHTLILSTNPEAQALWKEPDSTVTMELDAECVPVVRDFIR